MSISSAERARKVAVEIDGRTHSTQQELAWDKARSAELQQLGYRVFRAHNAEVYENIDGVLDTLLAFMQGSAD